MQIGQLAAQFDLNTKTIRYYESVGLLPEPPRNESGYRQYDTDDVDRLGFIRRAQQLGLSLDDIREILSFRDDGQAPCGHVVTLLQRNARDLDRRISQLQALRDELNRLVAQAETLPVDSKTFCRVIEHADLPTEG
jgi:DNA-binding transcriptional MerR regulator